MTKQLTLSIKTKKGVVNATVDSDKFTTLIQKTRSQLAEIDAANEEFKSLVEDASIDTKIPKTVLSKYLKARFRFETEAMKEQAVVFENLDNLVDG